jgi:hypothetical protein
MNRERADISCIKMLAIISLDDREDMERGRKIREAAARGGRRNPQRDRSMAIEYLKRRPLCRATVSNSELKRRIGAEYGLKRSAAIEAIDRGLCKIRPPTGEPDGPS